MSESDRYEGERLTPWMRGDDALVSQLNREAKALCEAKGWIVTGAAEALVRRPDGVTEYVCAIRFGGA